MARACSIPPSPMKLIQVVRTLALSAPMFGVLALPAQNAPAYPNFPSETPTNFEPATSTWAYTPRELMIPMRDGVRLHTVILIPAGAKPAPTLVTPTPYEANTPPNPPYS